MINFSPPGSPLPHHVSDDETKTRDEEISCARTQRYIPSGFATYIKNFIKANIVWDEISKTYRPNDLPDFSSIDQAINNGTGRPLITLLARLLFFGNRNLSKMASLAYKVLDYAIDQYFIPAEGLLQHHRCMGFGYKQEEASVKYFKEGNQIFSGPLTPKIIMYPASNSRNTDYLISVRNILAIDRRITNLHLSLCSHDFNPTENTHFKSFMATLSKSPYLESLFFVKIILNTQFEKASSHQDFEQMVAENRKLKHLFVGFDSLEGKGDLNLLLSLIKGLSVNKTLSSLTLENLTPRPVAPKPYDFENTKTIILNSLATNFTLTRFSLNRFLEIPEIFFQALALGLLRRNALEHLSFEHTDLSLVKDYTKIAQAISVHPSLKTINLHNTNLRNPTPIILALSTNTSVTKIDMSSIRTPNEAGEALAATLRVNTAITHFNINGHFFTNNTLLDIAQSLKYNSTLTTLDFLRAGSPNLPPSEFLTQLSEIISWNGSLTCCSYVSGVGSEALSRNAHRKFFMNIPLLTTLLNELDYPRRGLESVFRMKPAS